MGNKIFAVLCWGLFALSPSFCLAQGSGEKMKLDATVGLNAYEALVEGHLTGVLTGLRALAATDEAKSGIWLRIRAPLEILGKRLPARAAVWFVRPDGSYFTLAKGLTGKTLKDRAYFPVLLAGKDVEGSLVVSTSTGQRSIIVAAPVVRTGKVIGALGVSLSAVKLARQVAGQMGHQKNVIFYALDGKGQTALHYESSLIFAFPSDMGDKSLKSAVHTMLSKPKGVVNYMFRGQAKTVLFQRSKLTGWVFVLGTVHAH